MLWAVYEWSVVLLSLFPIHDLNPKLTPSGVHNFMGKLIPLFFLPIAIDNYLRQTYEFGITLISEISLIWKSLWSIPKVLFLITRYLPFISLIITLLRELAFFIRTGSRWLNVTDHVLPNLSTGTCLSMEKYTSCQFYIFHTAWITANCL